MIDAVIFDLDNTLYSYDRCNSYAHEMLGKYMETQGVSAHDFFSAFSRARDEVKERLGYDFASRHNRMLYCQRCCELLGINPFKYSLEMYDIYWNNFLSRAELFDSTMEFFEYVRNRKIKTAICTDMTVHIQHRKILRLGIENMIDCMVSSEEAGCEKPNAPIFLLTAEKLGVNDDECLYIGDDYKRDIVGATDVGMTAVHFSDKSEDDKIFHDWKSILEYIINERIIV